MPNLFDMVRDWIIPPLPNKLKMSNIPGKKRRQQIREGELGRWSLRELRRAIRLFRQEGRPPKSKI